MSTQWNPKASKKDKAKVLAGTGAATAVAYGGGLKYGDTASRMKWSSAGGSSMRALGQAAKTTSGQKGLAVGALGVASGEAWRRHAKKTGVLVPKKKVKKSDTRSAFGIDHG